MLLTCPLCTNALPLLKQLGNPATPQLGPARNKLAIENRQAGTPVLHYVGHAQGVKGLTLVPPWKVITNFRI